jgi:hypothetical protein
MLKLNWSGMIEASTKGAEMFESPDWAIVEARRAAAAQSEQLGYAERMAAEEKRFEREFFAAVLRGDTAANLHGRTTYDRVDGKRVDRKEMLWETMAALLDYQDLDRLVMRALASCARRGDVEAQTAVKAMAYAYGQINAEVSE